ncbi:MULTISPECIES: competence/damage-inducible protein A [Leeuwenhoekiella]|jgi:nicotinamide-nucleotide amidase|uniref:competence/damage-inducible protein A n=1 Tax=Leeuwenhoekiella TaxID=283735 RepID=UPI000C452C20|nr:MULTISPECIES: competence/damage-inducible protein A [Leeuwenhoekiella]MAO44399.1 competence/damage-inducible protein A [Leeuwenhoekiella sp.]HBT09613.1 competence/damage-inducible protein A [Leeuwenhoekiella sp.]HCW64907.1 competence/damage-inducible protein A [Leeuwenhoekiella sp.]|tara:strand:+ start:1952 stop:3199 length:1248 start_codon:yes stop_codon:yes gene_type:complete
MRAHIITIGDEILIGQIVDTNSAFIAKELDKVGIEVHQISSISDNKQHILQSLAEAQETSELVLITGGLGPTKDDVTKHTFCEYFQDTLVEDPAVLQNIERIFKHHVNRPMLPANRSQALVPSKATVLMNKNGTAPGMWMQSGKTVFVSMPGVPFEMKALMTDEVIPRVQQTFSRPFILHKTLQTYGRGESEIANTIEDWEDNLPSDIKLAYLPALGKVRLRLSTKGPDKALLERRLEEQITSLKALIGDIIVGYDDDELIEKVVGSLLTNNNKTLAVAESCTGGQIAAAITAIPGASSYFKGGMVTYATHSKVELLKIDQAVIDEHSVVSAQVAEAMAAAVKNWYQSDYAISTTGNAGPSKGDSDAEVGTVFIGIATPTGVFSQEFKMGSQRERVISKSVNKAFELLQKEILKN